MPYQKVTTSVIRFLLRKYLNIAGINTQGKKQGPHSLRSSLASSMINDGTSYETVKSILGHDSRNMVKHYARIDIEKMLGKQVYLEMFVKVKENWKNNADVLATLRKDEDAN